MDFFQPAKLPRNLASSSSRVLMDYSGLKSLSVLAINVVLAHKAVFILKAVFHEETSQPDSRHQR